MALPVAAAGVALVAVGLMTGSRAEACPKPYRFRVADRDLDAEIAWMEARVTRTPVSALDLAQLAGMYLAKARSGGDAWREKAAATAARSLEALPMSNAGATLVLAQVANARHDFAEAARLAEGALRESPRSGEAMAVLVTARLAQGRVEEAARVAEALVARIPCTSSLTLRALAREAAGREDEARRDFERAIDLEDHGEVGASAHARAMLGRFHSRRGRHGVAIAYLREAARLDGAHLMLLAQAELAAGRLDDAERHARDAAAGGEPELVAVVADVREARGDAAGARALRERAAAVLREEVNASPYGHRRWLAEVLLKLGEKAEAARLLEEEIVVRRDAETLRLLAEARRALNVQ
jgi:tetratricopeptide (TPR) repeat protein